MPLLKGFGTEAADAGELAAKRNLEAGVLTLRQTISQQVLTTVSSYWDYLAAVRNLEQTQVTEERAEQNYSDTSKLIKGNKEPPAKSNWYPPIWRQKQPRASRPSRPFPPPRPTLGLAMGLTFGGIESLPPPVG